MKYELLFFTLLAIFQLELQAQKNTSITVSGKITVDGLPLKNVKITNTRTNSVTASNSAGLYQIQVNYRDELVFSHVGKQTIKRIIGDGTKVLNIEMFPDIEELEEVVLKKKRTSNLDELRKEWVLNRNLYRSGIGYIDITEKSPGVVIMETIPMDSLDHSKTDFLLAIEKIVGGYVSSIGDDCPRLRVHPKGLWGGRVIFDVDGIITKCAPIYLALENIDRMTIIAGLSVMAKYSTRTPLLKASDLGAVMVINTKRANEVLEAGTKKKYDFGRLRNNIYQNDAKPYQFEFYKGDMEVYKDFKTTTEAFQFYNKNKESYSSKPFVQLKIAEYFRGVWHQNEMMSGILEEVMRDHASNNNVLRAIAYIFDESGAYAKSRPIYQTIAANSPDNKQAIRDLANNLALTNNTAKSLKIYKIYNERKASKANNAIEIDSIVNAEVLNIVKKIPENKDANLIPDFIDSRVLVEWNNSEAEFNLEIINPKKHTISWNHNYFEAGNTFNIEKSEGYLSKQFMIDNYLLGPWQINLTPIENKTLEPTYIKITLYRDFGKPTETVKSYVIGTKEMGVKRKILSFNNSPGLSH